MAKRGLVLAGVVSACVVLLQLSPRADLLFSEWSSPVNMGGVVNSSATEVAGEFSKDGLALYFGSDRLVSNSFDIWVSRRAGSESEWETPVALGSTINASGFNDIGPAFSRDGHVLFFQSNRPGGFGAGDIWMSWRARTKLDTGWNLPENLGAVVNTAFGETAPAFFEGDEDAPAELYFTSTRPRPGSGSKDEDIYVTVIGDDGRFGPPVRVAELCSEGNDGGPTISHNGREMYFYSDRPGSAASDIYVSTRPNLSAPWSTPLNLSVANSAAGDAHPALSADGTMLVFNSARPGGYGGHDLYVMTRTKGQPNH